MKLRDLKPDEVKFTVHCEPEDDSVRGNVMASGDDVADRKAEDEILDRLRDGYEWAWCRVKVEARWHNWIGSDFLGCCSYKDEEEFLADAYFRDMKARALEDLNRRIQYQFAKVETLLTTS